MVLRGKKNIDSSLSHSLLLLPDSRDLETHEKRKKGVKKKESEEMMVAATNKELQFDWIMRSPNDRHSTGSFYSLIDGIHQMLNENLFKVRSDFLSTSIKSPFLLILLFELMILIITFDEINISDHS